MSGTTRHFILGTAGHVDHGKSALIKALTGTDTDRLKEERDRGISIELGFAELPLGDGTVLGVVDVPGHERFVKQMVAGAGGVDLAFLVVAADEGVMPQTVEHLEILASLGVRGGVIVITKLDLVERELAEVAAEEVRDLAAGTFLADKPAVLVSAVTGEGLDELRAAIRTEAEALPARSGEGPFRLPVDRLFTMPGAGVIVTGTCWSGSVAIGDQLVVEPAGAKVRVRDVQAHGRPVPRGGSGQRLALALHGVKKDEMERGYQVVSPGLCGSVRQLDARIDLVAHFKGELKNRQRVHVHHAGREVLGRVVLLDEDLLSHDAGRTSARVQLHLEQPLVPCPGDRLVLRFYSPLVTMAGGRVLAVGPPRRKRYDEKALAELAVLEEGDPAELFRQRLREAGTAGLPAAGHAEHDDDPAVLRVGKRLYDRALTADLAAAVDSLAREAYDQNPLRGGVSKEEARRRVKFDGGRAEWNTLVEALAAVRGWTTAGERIGPAGAAALPVALQAAVDKVETVLKDAGLTGTDTADLGGDSHESLRYLTANGR
ncbi:selenocysteine-specific translation elongation factor, partial [bacterium]|nr:selenocysteine-specific translation elongation factor [bacterium]MBU1675961.1 selenocysteine-specific translation elongation factor [bacterium]